jgi:hypothetical protein
MLPYIGRKLTDYRVSEGATPMFVEEILEYFLKDKAFLKSEGIGRCHLFCAGVFRISGSET